MNILPKRVPPCVNKYRGDHYLQFRKQFNQSCVLQMLLIPYHIRHVSLRAAMLKILLFPEESVLSGKHRPGKETLNVERSVPWGSTSSIMLEKESGMQRSDASSLR